MPKFKVTRTSDIWYGKDEMIAPPCSEAVTTSKLDEYGLPVFTVQIKSISDLLVFVKRHGEIVFDGETVEIYDTRRES